MNTKVVQKELCVTIEHLPIECFSKIFSYLDANDRIKIEGVCRRWQDVVKSSWRDVKHVKLEISNKNTVFLRRINGILEVKMETIHHGMIRSILLRCRPYTSGFSLSDGCGLFNVCITAIIVECFPNIEYLWLCMPDANLKEIAPLFIFNKNIKVLSLTLADHYVDDCMDYLPSPELVEELSIDTTFMARHSLHSLNKMLSAADSLRKLTLDLVSKETLRVIGEKRGLMELNLWSIHSERKFMYDDVLPITQLTNLEDFSLPPIHDPDDFIIALVANCQNIWKLRVNNELSERALDTIFTLPNLNELDIRDQREVTSSTLCRIPSTVTHRCVDYCENITDKDVISLIQRMPDLVELFIGACPITARTFEAAVTATRVRTNSKVLHITYFNSEQWDCDIDDFKGKSPLLKLTNAII